MAVVWPKTHSEKWQLYISKSLFVFHPKRDPIKRPANDASDDGGCCCITLLEFMLRIDVIRNGSLMEHIDSTSKRR
jgi:hypothetical protein